MRPCIFLLALLGCSAKPEVDSGTTDTAPDSTTPVTDVVPIIETVDRAECTTQQSAGDTWDFSLTVNDPQGADTVDHGEYVVLSEKGGELTREALDCTGGGCYGYFRADLTGIGCDMVGEVSITFVVVDESGNESEPFIHQTK